MDRQGNILKQVSQLCSNYPGMFTAAEVVGRAFLLLGNDLGTTEKVRVLTKGLKETELLKLVQAANEVALAWTGADGYRVGMAYRAVEGGARGIDVGDHVVPMDFVHALRRAVEKSKSGSSAVG